jgi:hypothetical protein
MEAANGVAGYVIVLCPEHVGQLHGDTVNVIMSAGRPIAYRGIDRDPWWNLDDMFYEGVLDDALARLRRDIEASGLDCFSAGLCENVARIEQIRSVTRERRSKDEIIWIDSAFAAAANGSRFLGYDCYVDGFGSPLRLGIFRLENVFCDYRDKLNAHGLFSDLETLRAYVHAYCARCEQAGLEIIEASQVTDASFFRIHGVANEQGC